MTFRRLMLVVLPLLGAMFVYMFLRWLYIDWERSVVGNSPMPTAGRPEMPTGKEQMKTMENVGHEVSTNLNLIRKDRQGRPEMRFIAARVEHETAKTADIERPRIQYFTKNGEIITLLADRARAVTKGSMLKMEDIESGVLWGHVVMIHDRGTPDDHSDDLLVSLDDLAFNNETYTLTTEGPVIMVGLEMDLTARKMLMALDRDTRRINKMTFYEDIHITLSSGDRRRMGILSPIEETPGGPAPAAAGGGNAGGAAASAPIATPGAAAAPRPGSEAGPTTPAAKTPAATPAVETPTPADNLRGDLWLIDLAGDVDARQGTQVLTCEHLMLYNRGSTSDTGPASPARTAPAAPIEDRAVAPGAAKAPAGKAAPAKSTAPGGTKAPAARTAPAEPPPQNIDLLGGEGVPSREGAAYAKAKFLLPDAPPPMIVLARGPLIITPVNTAERKKLGDEANLVTAAGDPVVVVDDETRVEGPYVQYNMRSGSGSVGPNPDDKRAVGKPTPIILDQPGRLHLTGTRLDFDRRNSVAEVFGEGQLHAQAETAGISGSRKPATETDVAADAAPKEPGTLDAVWTRGMRMEFYRLPAGANAGSGEIKRALFHGDAEVNQKEGFLKGDELEIWFYKPLADGKGQAVERLIGHGGVLVKNNQAPAAAAKDAPAGAAAAAVEGAKAASKDSSKMTVGDITCQDLDITFARDATGGTQPKQLKANGGGMTPDVIINDSQGRIRARDLTATFGITPDTGKNDVQYLDAVGNVLIDRQDLHAEGEHIRRDLATGRMLLEGAPARAQRGKTRIVGPRIDFNELDGKASVTGAGELEMPATTDLRGRQRAEAEPMIVKWKNGMLFEDKRNFAQFDGGVSAVTGTSHIASERLWIYFADRPEPFITPTTPPKAKPKSSVPGGDTGQFFGNKAMVRVLAEKNVRAVEQQYDTDQMLRYQMEIAGENLTYVEENRKAYVRGVGWLRILSREKAKSGFGPGLAPETIEAALKGPAPEGYARTLVKWTESMAYDGAGNRAFFQGDVDTTHTGRGAPGDSSSRGRVASTQIKSSTMHVLFQEKKPAEPGAAPVPAPAPVAAGPDTAREERMSVDKLIADGGVLLFIDDRRGSCERLVYQRAPEMIRLYRGAEDWARLWQENEAQQDFGEIVARVITFDPATGRVDVVDQQSITVTPKTTKTTTKK